MPEKLLYDPAAWIAIKLFGAVLFLLTAIGVYEHRQIAAVGKKITEADKIRQDKCMTKEQCSENRDYIKDMLDKIYAGQGVIHKRVDVIYNRSSQSRGSDRHDESTGQD